jgi:hypothetical protein
MTLMTGGTLWSSAKWRSYFKRYFAIIIHTAIGTSDLHSGIIKPHDTYSLFRIIIDVSIVVVAFRWYADSNFV